MKNRLLLLASLLLVFMAQAQPPAVGHLTIFAEDGDKFYLVLNGERQNLVAQTNLRVEDLTQDYYNAKIIFEDKAIPEISKNYLPIADANSVKQDVTYKIKKDKNNGKMTLKFFSMVPTVQNYVAPSNVHVVHYGTPPPPTEVTTTRTTTTTNDNVAVIGMNVPGVNMNVTINDPLLGATTTTTTRTTTTTTRTDDYPDHHHHEPVRQTPPPPVGCINKYAMSATDFSSALATIKNQGFDETRLKTAKQIAGSNCLNTTQITQMCREFGFEATKLDFAKYAYDFCTEPKNYFKVSNVFGFSSSTDELNEYIQGKH